MGKGPRGAKVLGPLTGSARASSYNKRNGVKQETAPNMEGEDDEDMSPEARKLMEIKTQMEQVEIDIIQNGGINCGWDASDHKDFLRI